MAEWRRQEFSGVDSPDDYSQYPSPWRPAPRLTDSEVAMAARPNQPDGSEQDYSDDAMCRVRVFRAGLYVRPRVCTHPSSSPAA
jgi:hypothetical protein